MSLQDSKKKSIVTENVLDKVRKEALGRQIKQQRNKSY